MNETYVHVEVYFKYHTNTLEKVEAHNKVFNVYNLEDKDSILFTETMFRECLKDYLSENDLVRTIEAEDLQDRLWLFNQKIQQRVPSNLVFKLQKLIDYIKDNRKDYIGIKIIY